jgi:NAD+ synthase (glutamine-hydrolysing)
MKTCICQINSIVGDISGNTKKILAALDEARENNADIVVLPEMAICGYPPEDLLLFNNFIDEINVHLKKIVDYSHDLFVVVGMVRVNDKIKGKNLFNSAAIIANGKLLGYKDKTLLPTYDIFNETRYFAVGEKQKVWEYGKRKIGVLICEDVWAHLAVDGKDKYLRDPVDELKQFNPDLVINISASPYYFNKKQVRNDTYSAAAVTLGCHLICCNQVGANDQLVFDGNSCVVDRNGEITAAAKSFEEDVLIFDDNIKLDRCDLPQDPYGDLFQALVLGVKDYFKKQNLNKACIGISGGIDSAVVACIAVEALGKDNILGVSMPSRFTSLLSMEDAKALSENIGIELKDIPIDGMYQNFLDLMSPFFYDTTFDTTEENLQARIRGMILMALSNKFGYLVLSTGNKSEMAMGYCTLYGDMCGGLGVLVDVSKTLVYKLACWINKNRKNIIPLSIIDRQPSAELRHNQVDTDSLPNYDVVDTVLQEYVEEHKTKLEIINQHGLRKHVVDDLIKKIHLAEYKRRQAPPGIRVTKKAFSKGRLLPIVQQWIK